MSISFSMRLVERMRKGDKTVNNVRVDKAMHRAMLMTLLRMRQCEIAHDLPGGDCGDCKKQRRAMRQVWEGVRQNQLGVCAALEATTSDRDLYRPESS